MGWFVRGRRGISWIDQALDSISLPPLPLLVFFGIFIMLMFLDSYSEFQEKIERSKMGLRIGLLIMPLVGVLVVNMVVLSRRWWHYVTGKATPVYYAVKEDGGPPWGLVVVLVLLVVLVYYQSSFQSLLFR